MNELIPPDGAIGALALALIILYAAWHEYKERNRRDASLLAVVGALGLIGSAVAWVH
jgi:multisubunit Na+/H+ antiporter MnhB subunit